MHKNRMRKKIAKRLKAEAIRIESRRAAISVARSVLNGAQYGAFFARAAGHVASHIEFGRIQRMASTPADLFYRRHYGYPEIRPAGQVLEINLDRYGELGPAVSIDTETLRRHLV